MINDISHYASNESFQWSNKLLALASLAAAKILASVSPEQAIFDYKHESGGNVIVETVEGVNVSLPFTAGSCNFNGILVASFAVVCTGEDAVMCGYTSHSSNSFGGNGSLYSASAVSGVPHGTRRKFKSILY